MDFEFENKDDIVYDDAEMQEEFENFSDEEQDEYEDISSSSKEGYDIMSSSAPKKKKRNVKRIIINSVTSVVLAISILISTMMGWYIGNADSTLQDVPLLQWLFGASKYGDISYEEGGENDDQYEKWKISDNVNVTYFLVVGCDWTSSKQTDVIVVVCMDHKNKTVSMLQIPRDTYTDKYSADGKINSVYVNAREGELKINALRRCLSDQLAIPIDHYILFSIEGAVNVVDAIGGVEMNLKNSIRIEDPLDFGTYYNIGPGKIRMTGKDAIGFMRKRDGTQAEDENYDGSDIGRIKQQRKFYAALFKELLNMSKSELWKIANSCFNQVQTDLTLNETLAFATEAMKLDSKDIHIFGLPGQACSYGLSYYSIHKDDYVTMFNKYFNPYGEKITEEDVGMPELYSIAGYQKNDYWMNTDDSTLDDY